MVTSLPPTSLKGCQSQRRSLSSTAGQLGITTHPSRLNLQVLMCRYSSSAKAEVHGTQFLPQTISGLFSDIKDETLEFTVAQRIWAIIIEVINIIAELTSCDLFELTKKRNKQQSNQSCETSHRSTGTIHDGGLNHMQNLSSMISTWINPSTSSHKNQ